ncbi:MAG TPA: mannosyltransferase family protein [Gemmataceae bacterium]|nr:mannosyltransferase family protein [Gemmataceae bacterium]
MQSTYQPPTESERLHSALPARVAVPDRLRQAAAVIVPALAVTLGQVVLACTLSGRSNLAAAYQALDQWDSQWYARLAEQGYPDTLPEVRADMAKLGFFPGYPLFARLVAAVTGLPATTALLVAAQVACWGFWTYVFLFLRRWQVPAPVAAAGVLAVLVHPCAFFLVAGYSESLFLLSVLGFFYWCSVRTQGAWLLAAAHGVVMASTRIVGLPLAVCPLLLSVASLTWGERGHAEHGLRRVLSAGLLGGLASLGGLLFFAFCRLQYGRWDAYMYCQHAGWGITPDYLALFNPEIYRVAWPGFIDGLVNPNDLSRLCVPGTIVLFLALALIECRAARGDRARTWRERAGLYLAGGLLFYIAVAGLANSGLVSMIRYSFCAHVVLALAAVHLAARVPSWKAPAGRVAVALFTVALVVSAVCQLMLAHLFTHGEWVA